MKIEQQLDLKPVVSFAPLKGDKIKSVTIMDFSWVLHKSWNGHASLTCDVQGFPVSVGDIYGVLMSVLGLIKRKPDGILFLALDGSTNKRKALVGDYKGQRDDEVRKDIYLKVHEILEAACLIPNVYLAYHDEYEADDVIFTLSEAFGAQGLQKYIYAVDNDFYQFLNDSTWMVSKLQSSMKYFKPEDVFKKYKVLPHQMVFLRALIGDSSDNLSGYPRIPKKTAQVIASSFSLPTDLLEATGDELKAVIEGKPKSVNTWINKIREEPERLVTNYRMMKLRKVPRMTLCRAPGTREPLKKYKLYSILKAMEELAVAHGFEF